MCLFTNAVVRRRRLPAATWSSIWYLLSSFAVISYTPHWGYVIFAALGSFIGAYSHHDLPAPEAHLSAATGRFRPWLVGAGCQP